jgi:hypothetical protein
MRKPLLLAAALLAGLAHGAVHRLYFVERSDVLGGRSLGPAGPYERIIAKAYFRIDPKLEANRIISDIDLAPRNADGMVEFSADVYVLRPTDPARGNGTLLFEVSNRGRKGMLGMFNLAEASLDPRTEAEFGDALLLEQGYTLVWVGWQFDVPRREGLMRLYAPVARNPDGSSITGLIRAEFVPDARIFSHSLADREHVAYPVADPNDPETRLTVRDRAQAPRSTIPRADWQFARLEGDRVIADPTSVYLKGGFEPGKIYEVIYRAKDPVLVGLGPAAVRDMISFLKYGVPDQPIFVLSDSRRFIKRAIGFGTSQSGRFLRTFLYYGFNRDERNRQVFDGVWAHVAGAGRGSFNHRFAQPSRDGHPHLNTFYPTDIFPFTDLEQVDPVTGWRGGILLKAQQDKVVPKIFYTNCSYEYWGRSASLIHTSPDGASDAPLAENTRVYLIAGAQHGPGSFPPARSGTQHLSNPNDYRWAMRALLEAFQRWLAEGVEPPPSTYPLVAKGELVPPDRLAFPKLAGVAVPRRIQRAWRVDYGPEFLTRGIVAFEPPKIVGEPYVTLVPQVDADGNEIAGIRLPVVEAALGSFTGWNLRAPNIGAAEELYSMVGSFIPFARTKAEREKTGDPRPSVEERYQSREAYLSRLRAAAEELVRRRFVRKEDIWKIVETGAAQWDFLMAGKAGDR